MTHLGLKNNGVDVQRGLVFSIVYQSVKLTKMIQEVSKPAEKTASYLKAGHPPAVKAGGKRVANKILDESTMPEKDTKRDEKLRPVPAHNRIYQVNMLLSGAPDKFSHEFPDIPESVRHGKVCPSIEKSHCPHTYFIHQPKKF